VTTIHRNAHEQSGRRNRVHVLLPLDSTHSRRFLSYAAVGAGATSVHYLILVTCVEAVHLRVTIASTIGALAGALIAYAGNRRYAFVGSAQPHKIALRRFLLIASLGVLLNATVLWVGVEVFQVYYLPVQLLATGMTLSVTYALNTLWTFT
jgi:putative flippase GtrA